MLNLPHTAHTARTAGGIFDRLDAEWATLCADASVQAAVADWLMADHLGDDVAAVTDSWARTLGPAQLLAALTPHPAHRSDALADAVLRALLVRAAGRDRSATLAARIIVQAMVPAAVRLTRGQVRPVGGRCFETVGHTVIVALYEAARSGRIHHRASRPAANLMLDALRQVCRELAADRETCGIDFALVEDWSDADLGTGGYAHAWTVQAAAAAVGLHGSTREQEAGQARLELLALLLDAMEAGTLTAADAQSIAWHYSTLPIPDAAAAARAGTTAWAWQRRRSRAVHTLKAAHASVT
ncbi:hypothetical protein [Streptomyces xanthochromogenes]|uniref:Uncharacterized protein n=1 Tax=Streptomyces xanthochromogenes TaxID=67384 RepID=A0ABQ3AZQ6_9ACTN|nr:hypothetical protein [Streptomyces xanthochromogenes]GGY71944.1 hypothetical protein GCM10010326_77700 [Streptomyces xanthochromogenes]